MLMIACILQLSQCSRSRPAGPASPAEEATAAEQQDGSPMRLTDAGVQRTAPAPRAPTPSLAIDPRDSAFAAHRLAAPALYPYDFRIGTLRTGGLSAAERSARTAARDIITRITTAGILPAAGPQGGAPGLRHLLEEFADDVVGFSTVRVGRSVPLGRSEYAVPFALLDRGQRWVGELVLEGAEGEWYITDIQVRWLGSGAERLFGPDADAPGLSW